VGSFRWGDIDAAALGLWEGERPVLVYNHGVRTKPGLAANNKHSDYIHPLYGLDGEVLTDDFPRDHIHHRGLFWAWPHVTIAGREYDLWTLRGIQPCFQRWRERKANAASAVLAAENAWFIGDKKVMDEEVRIRVWPTVGDERWIDLELCLTACGSPVTLRGAENKGYGGLSLRFAPRRQTVITTPDGRQKEDLNLKRLFWTDLTARFPGGSDLSGVALFVNLKHPDAPVTWITRAYGFLAPGWPGPEAKELQPGKPVQLRYRILIHRGAVPENRLEKYNRMERPKK
jgi:hypothetical protein